MKATVTVVKKGPKTASKLPPWMAKKAEKACKKCGKSPCKCK